MSSAFLLWNTFLLDFITEANARYPDQTAPLEQSDLGPFFVQYKAT